MKTFLGALALTLSVPVAAQSAPATDLHTGQHAQAQPMDHSQHQQGRHDCKACCKKMKGKDGKMDCKEDAPAKPAASEQSHEGHAH